VDFYSAGGGGYSNPLERDPQEVKRDVMLGYVSIKKARQDYGVVIDHANLNVDQVETQKLRASRTADTND
jgi:N-methylhydantoinase B